MAPAYAYKNPPFSSASCSLTSLEIGGLERDLIDVLIYASVSISFREECQVSINHIRGIQNLLYTLKIKVPRVKVSS